MQQGRSRPARSYQLLVRVARPVRFRAGRLGDVQLEAGLYVYTGSARRGLEARIARHLRRSKRLFWHVDRLLAAPGVRVIAVRRSSDDECGLHRKTPGTRVLPGFGASDCRAGCGTHLLRLDGPPEGTGPGPGWERVD